MEQIITKEIKDKYYVYFYYDINDVLLYVGLSNDIYTRFLSHMNDKEWSSEIASIGYREYSNEKTMKFAENYYIGKLKPKYNIIGNCSGELFMDVNDPSRETRIDKKSFVLKYGQTENNVNKKTPQKRLTAREKFIKDGWNIVEKSYIDIFDENIMCLDLNKTAFFYDDTFFYLSGDDLLKNEGGVNITIESLKSYFTANLKFPVSKAHYLFLNLMNYDDKGIGSQPVIGCVSGKNNFVNKVKIIEELPYINFSNDKFILDFKIYKYYKKQKMGGSNEKQNN